MAGGTTSAVPPAGGSSHEGTGKFCLSATVVKWKNNHVTAHPLRCKCWSCKNCQPYRKAQLIKLGHQGKPNKFITITVSPKVGNSPAHRALLLSHAWRRVVRYCRTTLKMKSVEYLAIFERHKSGEPHLHIIARMPYLPQHELSRMMQELIGSPIVDIRKANSTRAVTNYITKYVGKNPTQYTTVKRYQYSRKWISPTRAELRKQRDPNEKIFRVPYTFSAYRQLITSLGVKIVRDYPSTLEVMLDEYTTGPPGTPPRWQQG